MCQCGCADFRADYQFPGPDGFVYAFQIYTPCRECSTPLGVIVHKFTVAEAKNWGLDMVPPMKFDGSAEMADAHIALLSPEALRKRMATFAKEAQSAAAEDDDAYDADGLIQDAVGHCLVDAICDTVRDSTKRR